MKKNNHLYILFEQHSREIPLHIIQAAAGSLREILQKNLQKKAGQIFHNEESTNIKITAFKTVKKAFIFSNSPRIAY
jgi:hypothetical protein